MHTKFPWVGDGFWIWHPPLWAEKAVTQIEKRMEQTNNTEFLGDADLDVIDTAFANRL